MYRDIFHAISIAIQFARIAILLNKMNKTRAVFEPGCDLATFSCFLFECRTKINRPCHPVTKKPDNPISTYRIVTQVLRCVSHCGIGYCDNTTKWPSCVAGRNIFRTLFRRSVIERNELFLPRRMAYVIDLEDDFNESDIPVTLIRSKADCPTMEVSVADRWVRHVPQSARKSGLSYT